MSNARNTFDPSAIGGKAIAAASNDSAFDPDSLGAEHVQYAPPSPMPDNAPVGTAGVLSKIISQRDTNPQRQPFPQEETSNPSAMPGFGDLPQSEKIKRIMASSMDGANQSPDGRFVPPGAYDTDAARMAATTIPQLLQPELRTGNILADYGVNALARVGAGTGANIVQASPDINSLKDLKDVAKNSLTMNGAAEAVTAPGHLASGIAEIYQPHEFAGRTAAQMRNEHLERKDTQQQIYAPVMNHYGNYIVTSTPRRYLGFSDSQIRYMTPDVRKAYRDFLDSPTFQNLHDFQSQAGRDAARVSGSPAKINTAQTLTEIRDIGKSRIQGYLRQDPRALARYNAGSDYTRDFVAPGESNKTLRQINEGLKLDFTPAQIRDAIKSGTEKTAYRDAAGNNVPVVPQYHPLQEHLRRITNRINLGRAAHVIIPGVVGAAVGQALHPGIGGIASGILSGEVLGGLGSHYGPNMADFIQNPLIQSAAHLGKNAIRFGTQAETNSLNKKQLAKNHK